MSLTNSNRPVDWQTEHEMHAERLSVGADIGPMTSAGSGTNPG